MSQEGTEQATPQRKKKAREDGDIVHSRELCSAIAMLFGVMTIGGLTQTFLIHWSEAFRFAIITATAGELSLDGILDAIRRTISPSARPVLFIMVASLAGSLLSGIAQSGGITLHPKSIAFKFNRLDIFKNFGNLFSLRSTTRLARSLIPAAVMVAFGWNALHPLLLSMPVISVLRVPAMFSTAYSLVLDAAWVSLAWAALDYGIEWRSWNDRLKMTKQEIREEMKDAMGNPQMRGRIRQIQRAMRRRRIKADISRASVVITNPTHYAVALEFSFETMQAPIVIAKGRDLQAADIREAARWAGVPIIENPPLARSLYRSVEEGQSIPFELYQTVAGILAFLYRQQVEERLRREREAKQRAAAKATAANPTALRPYLNPPIKPQTDFGGGM